MPRLRNTAQRWPRATLRKIRCAQPIKVWRERMHHHELRPHSRSNVRNVPGNLRVIMKNIFIFLILAALGGVAVAQNAPPQTSAPVPQQNAAQESSSRQQTQPAPAAPQQPISQQQVQAKTKAEYDAYLAADKTVSKDADLSKGEAAAAAFQEKFPQSQLSSILYDKLMKRYQQAENTAKSLEMARKELALDPKSVPALLTAASLLAGSAHESDVNFAQEYTETLNDAHAALQMLESGTFNPPGLTPEQ